MDLGITFNKNTQTICLMKFFEYISAGLRVVSTEIAFAKNHTKGICTTSDTDDFIGKERNYRKKLNLNERLTIVAVIRGPINKLMQKLIDKNIVNKGINFFGSWETSDGIGRAAKLNLNTLEDVGITVDVTISRPLALESGRNTKLNDKLIKSLRFNIISFTLAQDGWNTISRR